MVKLTSLKNLGRTSVENNKDYFFVDVEALIPGKYQPRINFDEQELISLSESIKSSSIIEPLIVREIDTNKYEVIAGERRLRAAKLAGLTTVPVIKKSISDKEAVAFSIIENIQRKDLNPIEEATGLYRLKTEFKYTDEQIANHIGRSRSAVTNMLRILNLSVDTKSLINKGLIDFGHAKVLLSLDTSLQYEVAKQIIKEDLSVRATEMVVKKISSKKYLQTQNLVSLWDQQIQMWRDKLSSKIDFPIKVNINKKGHGYITIQFDNLARAEWLIENLNTDSKLP